MCLGEGIVLVFPLRRSFLGRLSGVMARCEVFDPDGVLIAHIFNRVCRRCFLMGADRRLYLMLVSAGLPCIDRSI
jgi:hypothetical protein